MISTTEVTEQSPPEAAETIAEFQGIGVTGQAGVTAVGCMAHARRRFDALLKSVGQYSDRPEALMNAEAVEPY